MKKTKLGSIALCGLALVMGLTQAAYASSFTDVPDTHWARPYIEELSSAGVLKGFPDGTFKPNDPVSLSETFSLIKGIKNPTEEELRQAVLSYGNMARRAGVEDWAYEAAAYALEQRVITEKQIMEAAKAVDFELPDETGDRILLCSRSSRAPQSRSQYLEAGRSRCTGNHRRSVRSTGSRGGICCGSRKS